ncbi:MAG: hypothetical protein O2975_06765 [Proteobacteria bacterium]|nr:hypothetical protein [Pseudomonadota bacterium]
MRALRRFAHLLLAAVLLGACAPLGTITFEVPEAGTPAFSFHDARPPGLRQSRLLVNAGRVVEVFGDDRLAPPIPRLLPALLQRDLGDRLRGARVVLTSFELIMVTSATRFNPDNYRNVVGRSPGNDPAPGVSGSGFSVAGGPARYSAQVVGSVNGRAFQARSDVEAPFESDAEAARAVLGALAGAVTQIRAAR